MNENTIDQTVWTKSMLTSRRIDGDIMDLLTPEQYDQLVANGKRQAAVMGTNQEIDFNPVVKLFNPALGHYWLLTEIQAEPDIAFGIADLDQGCVEYGQVSLSELASTRAVCWIERDKYWKATKSLSQYLQEAKRHDPPRLQV